jgi:hypothetical protein
MSADFVFNLANPTALIGWIILSVGAVTKRPLLYKTIAGWVWPLGFSVIYSALIVSFFGTSDGGFNSLAEVQKLFASDWLATAGWIHYLAFDLFVGAWIAARVIDQGLPRLGLLILLPLTFMFGPAGLLAYFFYQLAFTKRSHQS